MDKPSPNSAAAGCSSEESAIQIVGAYKRYGKGGPWVLKNLSMTVPKKGIYGLLGSSGCGKTTLLTALTGFSSLDYGYIHTSISSPSRLGFMPQEIALFEEFTVGETFGFFARLYNIPPAQCALVTKELRSVLDLPPDDQRCATLSGGQARRVSIAVTLLHSPDIVILDEPTSGVDPLLAHCFWQYLTRLSRQGGRTIIITTHYIEEARQADMVALMRNGVLLAESPPEDLIAQFKVTTLEDVFLQLCYVQNKAEKLRETQGADDKSKKIQFIQPFRGKGQNLSTFWPHTMAIFFKIMTWIKANLLLFLALTFVTTTMCVISCNEMLSKYPPTSVGFVNEETGGDCANHTALEHQGCDRSQVYANLGCQFIQTWRGRNPDIPMIYYPNFFTAMSDGRRGKVIAVLKISGNFSLGISARLQNGLKETRLNKALMNLIASSNIDVWADKSEYMQTLKVESELRSSFQDMYRHLLTSCGYNPHVAELTPMDINTDVFFDDNAKVDMFDYSLYVNMNVIAGMSCLFSMMLLIPMLSVDKMSGAYARCHLAGVRTAEIFLAHGLFLGAFNLINTALMLYIYYTFYKVPRGSIWLTYLILNMGGVASTMLGLFTATVTNGVSDASSFLIIYILTMANFTGYTWPIEAVWTPIQPLSYVLYPNTLIAIAYRAIEWKGATIVHPQVMNALLYTIGYVLVLIVAIGLLLRRRPSFTSAG